MTKATTLLPVALALLSCSQPASRTAEPSAPPAQDIAVDVREDTTGEVQWGVGVSTGAGFQASLRFDKRNLDLYSNPGARISRFRIHFPEPDLIRTDRKTPDLPKENR